MQWANAQPGEEVELYSTTLFSLIHLDMDQPGQIQIMDTVLYNGGNSHESF